MSVLISGAGTKDAEVAYTQGACRLFARVSLSEAASLKTGICVSVMSALLVLCGLSLFS